MSPNAANTDGQNNAESEGTTNRPEHQHGSHEHGDHNREHQQGAQTVLRPVISAYLHLSCQVLSLGWQYNCHPNILLLLASQNHARSLAAGLGQQRFETGGQRRREPAEERAIDQPNVDHVAQVYAILVAVRLQFHSHQFIEQYNRDTGGKLSALIDGWGRILIFGSSD